MPTSATSSCDLGSAGLAESPADIRLYSHHDEAALTHLFEVAGGLDSAVLGESEILGQVRGAWELAQAEGGARSTLNLLFRHAIETGKRARTETAIGRGTASVSHAAVEMAVERLGTLVGRRVLVVGAGEMGEGMIVALCSTRASPRSSWPTAPARSAPPLAGRQGRRAAVPFSRPGRPAEPRSTCCSPAPAPSDTVIDVDTVRAARPAADAPLLIVDIAVPRDVDRRRGRPGRGHAAQPRRPADLGRTRPGEPGHTRPRTSPTSSVTRPSGSPSRPPPARRRRWSPNCATRPTRSAATRCERHDAQARAACPRPSVTPWTP